MTSVPDPGGSRRAVPGEAPRAQGPAPLDAHREGHDGATRDGVRRWLMLVVGATLSALVLVLPALYLHRWEGVTLPSTLLAWGSIPLLGLLVAVARPRPAWTLGLYPASHLPALIVAPELVGSRVFGGPQGALATLAVAAVAWTWLQLAARAAIPATARRAARRATPTEQPPAAPGGRWAWRARRVAGPFGAGVLVAFAAPGIVQREADPRAAVLSLLVGAVVVWYAVAELSPRRLDRVLVRERAARAAVGALFLESDARPRALVWALVAAALAGTLVGLWVGI